MKLTKFIFQKNTNFKFLLFVFLSVFLMSEECKEDMRITNMNVFPNPARDHVTLKMDVQAESDLDIIVFDSFGKPVIEAKKGEHVMPGEFTLDLDVHNLEPGAYFANIISGENRMTLKFMVAR